MESTAMSLKILLPFRIFADVKGVKKVIAESHIGSFGILPNRLDCVASLAPGILTYESEAEGLVYLAIDEGTIVKAGASVLISVRNAIGGTDLGKLHETVVNEFLNLDEREKNVRTVLAKLESGFIQHFRKLYND